VFKGIPGGKYTRKYIVSRALGASCFCVLFGILVAGLKPFNPFPKNEVSWQTGTNGLHFGDNGTIFTTGRFQTVGLRAGATCTIEIWLEAAHDNDENTFVAFYSPENPLRFRLQQYIDNILVRRDIRDSRGHTRTAEIEIDHVFKLHKRVFITIASGADGTSAYVDGTLVARSQTFGLTSEDTSGQIIIGTSPTEYATWAGQLLGLAVYNFDLSEAEVRQHYDSWTKHGQPEGYENEAIVALYEFDEQGGNVVHNRAGSAPDLQIPKYFDVVHKPLLALPWKEYYPGWCYVEDLAVNIVGFVPLGFLFGLYFSIRNSRRAALKTIVFGGVVSLFIEISQAYIPSRTSGITDLITNTSGTALGVLLCQMRLVRRILSRFGITLDQNPSVPAGKRTSPESDIRFG